MQRFGETAVRWGGVGSYKCKGLEVRWSLLFTSDTIRHGGGQGGWNAGSKGLSVDQ